MASAALQAEAEELIAVLPTISRIRYAALANTCIIIFDHLLTLDQEIQLIWRADWSLGKILFLVNRYYALVPVVFNNFVLFNSTTLSNKVLKLFAYRCESWIIWQGATGVFDFIVTELILVVRLYAMYFADKRVLSLLVFVFSSTSAAATYVMVRSLTVMKAYALQIPLGNNGTICVPTGVPSFFFAFWIPMLVSESVYLALALYRGIKTLRGTGKMRLYSGLQLIEILVRDSLFFFAVIFTTYLVNAIIFLMSPSAQIEIPIGFSQALGCVLSSRLCLNVKAYVREEQTSTLSAPFAVLAPVSASAPGAARSHTHFNVVSFTGPPVARGGGGFVRTDGGRGLSDVELHELRAMRAPSRTHHLRVLSLEKGGSVFDAPPGEYKR